jgi:4a-hydroxytetrahydrobiopterin dehydratase
METLQQQHCEICRSGAPPATPTEIAGFLGQLPQWQILSVDGIDRLSRSFAFRNFRAALEFTDRVGALAEAEGHHPLLVTEWGQVTVQWWTHKIGGLHRNDFVMAARTDALLDEPGAPSGKGG